MTTGKTIALTRWTFIGKVTRGRGRLRGFLELRRPWGFSPEARRGSQGASRAAPGKSGLHARGEGRDITLPTKVRLVKAMVFPVVMYGCESWTVKKAEH